MTINWDRGTRTVDAEWGVGRSSTGAVRSIEVSLEHLPPSPEELVERMIVGPSRSTADRAMAVLARASKAMPWPAAVAALVFAAGCATAYGPAPLSMLGQPSGTGYFDERVGPDTFVVGFRANDSSSDDRAVDFSLLRAAELALAEGAPYFTVLEIQDLSDSSTYVMSKRTSSVATQAGARIDVRSRTTGGYAIPIVAPGKRLVIQLRRDASDSARMTYRAAGVDSTVRAKYAVPKPAAR